MTLPTDPALLPPDGVIPNFNNPPDSAQSTLKAVLIFAVILCTILFSVRMFTRISIMHAMAIEDYSCLVAWVNLIGFTILGEKFFQQGVGIHQWNLTHYRMSKVSTYLYAIKIMYLLVLLSIKVCILLQLRRFFSPHIRSSTYYILTGLIIFNALFVFAALIADIFQCVPIRKVWNSDLSGKCTSVPVVHIYTATINIFSDLLILILPIVWTWRLKISVMQKLQVSAIFMSGLIACAASVMHLVESVWLSKTKDISYRIGILVFWALAELMAGFIVACLPIHPLFIRAVRARSIKSARSELVLGYSGRTSSKRSHHPDVSTGGSSSKRRDNTLSAGSSYGPRDPYMSRSDYIELGSHQSFEKKDSVTATISCDDKAGESSGDSPSQLEQGARSSSGIWKTVKVDIN